MSEAPRLVGIGSPGPGHGKTTLARYLAGSGRYQRRPFARPMKAMAEALLRELGFTWQRIDQLLTDPQAKEDTVPELGVSMRYFLQRLGTEFGRQQIHQDLWIDVWTEGARRAMNDGMPVVVDDMRFANELQRVRDMGGLAVYVIRSDAPVQEWKHASEGELRPRDFDLVINGEDKAGLMNWASRICGGHVAADSLVH